MDTVPITPNLTMLPVNGRQLYAWRGGDVVTLIDTGACFGHCEPISSGTDDRMGEVAATLIP